jgi:hypothetical protein
VRRALEARPAGIGSERLRSFVEGDGGSLAGPSVEGVETSVEVFLSVREGHEALEAGS